MVWSKSLEDFSGEDPPDPYAFREAVDHQLGLGRVPLLIVCPPGRTLLKRESRWEEGKRLRTQTDPEGASAT